MIASVIVCTYNRSASLAGTLDALAAQRVRPDTTWELVVVDNNSADGTRATVEGFIERGAVPRMRSVFEGKQGLSNARNTGLQAAGGRYLLFTDDDVLPEPEWIQTTVDAMVLHQCDGCGGYIGPLWEASPPSWLTERLYGFLALRVDLEGPKRVQEDEDIPFGANMAFRRAVFDDIGLFSPKLGRTGKLLAGGEEIDVFKRVLRRGGTVMYFPHARVHHKIEANRLRKDYFLRWRFQDSRNKALIEDVPGKRRVLGVPPYLGLQLCRAWCNALWGRLTAPADEALRRDILVRHFLGTVAGVRDRRH